MAGPRAPTGGRKRIRRRGGARPGAGAARDADPSPAASLRSFLGRFDPKHRTLIRAIRAALRKRLPTANELVYDYPGSVIIGYSPTERGIDAVVAVGARADGLRLYFQKGPRLPDPKGLLKGKGNQTRYVEIGAAREWARPEVAALIAAAVESAKDELAPSGKGRLLIRSEAASRRPRRKPAK